MPVIDLSLAAPPLTIGATGLDAITQNIRIIVTTFLYSVPLDRAFANTGTFIDAPTPHAVALRVAELTEAIEAREPRVKVEGITFSPCPDESMQGRVFPRILFRIKEGVQS